MTAPGRSRHLNLLPEVGTGITNVGVFDPIPLFRDALSEQIRRTPGLNHLGSTGKLSVAAGMRNGGRLDVLVMDSVLDPHGHFAQFIAGADPSIVILSLLREPLYTRAYVHTAFTSGVHGLVRRALPALHLIEVIRRISMERRYLDPALAYLATAPFVTQRSPDAMDLTRREHEVLHLVASGLQCKVIAAELFVSVETIRTHVKNICRKLNARDRAHAVATGFRTGLLSVDPGTHGSVRLCDESSDI